MLEQLLTMLARQGEDATFYYIKNDLLKKWKEDRKENNHKYLKKEGKIEC